MSATILASDLLAQHASLFWQARTGDFAGKVFVGAGHQLYDVTETLRGVESDLRHCGRDPVGEAESSALVNLTNILVQRGSWEGETDADFDPEIRS